MSVIGSGSIGRLGIFLAASDHATPAFRDKITVTSANSGSTNICVLVSIDAVADGSDHTVFYSFNGDTGAATFYIDGVDADDTGSAVRVAPTTGTLDTGAGSVIIGALSGPSQFYGGQAGYVGHDEQYLTNPTDFHHPTNGLQEIDESGWTEWGSQPLYWEAQGEMDAQEGSAGNMTKNGTITGPS